MSAPHRRSSGRAASPASNMQGSFNSSYEWAQSPAHYQHSPGGGEWRGEYWSADQQPGAFAHALQPVALVPAPQRQMVPVHVVEKVVDRPVEKIVYVDRPVETKVPVEKLVYVDRPYEVQVEKIVTVDRPVEIEKVVTKEVPVEVEKIVIQERVVEVPVPKVTMTEHVVEVPVDRIVTKEVEVPVEKIVERVRTEFVETEKIVVQEKLPETCPECKSFLDGKNPCSVCLLVQRLDYPQVPIIASQEGNTWSAADTEEIVVQVLHSRMDGWQNPCPEIILYVTTDGSEPSPNNYHMVGESPLRFTISQSVAVKAVAVNNLSVASLVVHEDFTRKETAGIGLLLEKMTGYRGIYVQQVIKGGAAWENGIIQPGDEIKEIDGESIEEMELPPISSLIVGSAGSAVRLKILREDRDDNGLSIDEQGAEFLLTLIRSPVEHNADPITRHPPASLSSLEGYRRVSIKHSKLRQQRPPIPRPSSRERAQSPVSMMLPRNITDSPSTAPPGKIPPMLHDCLPQPTDTLFGMTSILQGTSRSGSPYQSAKPASSPISYDFFGSRIK